MDRRQAARDQALLGLRWLLALIAGALLASCSHLPSPAERHQFAHELAKSAGWSPLLLATEPFRLQAWVPERPTLARTLTVYLEGDGLAWLDLSTPSTDPTPLNPLALRLAIKHGGAAAYLARPCQYVDAAENQACAAEYWTSRRFAPLVIAATSQALDQLKARWSASQLVLVGYSGGGAVAALVAAQRQDVVRLVTVAGNLDHAAWIQLKHVSPLSGSLNPADFVAELQAIPQWHLVGGRDGLMPSTIAESYVQRFPLARRPKILIMESFDHRCCWDEVWTPLDPQSLVGSAFVTPDQPR